MLTDRTCRLLHLIMPPPVHVKEPAPGDLKSGYHEVIMAAGWYKSVAGTELCMAWLQQLSSVTDPEQVTSEYNLVENIQVLVCA